MTSWSYMKMHLKVSFKNECHKLDISIGCYILTCPVLYWPNINLKSNTLQELTELEPKSYPPHQRERWTNTLQQTINHKRQAELAAPSQTGGSPVILTEPNNLDQQKS